MADNDTFPLGLFLFQCHDLISYTSLVLISMFFHIHLTKTVLRASIMMYIPRRDLNGRFGSNCAFHPTCEIVFIRIPVPKRRCARYLAKPTSFPSSRLILTCRSGDCRYCPPISITDAGCIPPKCVKT